MIYIIIIQITIIITRTSEPRTPPSKSAEELATKPPLTIRKVINLISLNITLANIHIYIGIILISLINPVTIIKANIIIIIMNLTMISTWETF